MAEGGIEVRECLNSWLAYLQTLNGLCAAGTKLAHSLQALLSVHDGLTRCRLTGQCLARWEELTRATNVASITVKNHVSHAMTALEETPGDTARAQEILCDNLLTFVNLQYQFCVACCECLGGMADGSCSQGGRSECDVAALQRCFERLYSPSSCTPVQHSNNPRQSQGSRLPYPLFPLQAQRRWSETAAAEMGDSSSENSTRRWSMPWDCPRQEQTRSKLTFPSSPRDRSRATTPDFSWKSSTMASQDGLREAIQLLSCKPGVRPSTQFYYPVPTLAEGSFDGKNDESTSNDGVWLDVRSGSRCWPRDVPGVDQSDHSELSGTSGSGHRDSKDSIHSQSDHSGISHRESDAGTCEILASRKSSSSTDSCVSAQSRSGSEGAVVAGESTKSPLYSMWSGGDLPFIKLSESNEQYGEDGPT